MKEMEWPYVTIGLCVKNNEKTVGGAIRSIINVDYPRDKMEVIVVDGMSKDKTVEIVKSMLKDTDINWRLSYDGGRGLAYARQIVVNKTCGKYIIWIDGDNIISSNFVKSQVKFMEQKPRVGVCSPFIIPKGESIVAKLQVYNIIAQSLNKLKSVPYKFAVLPCQGTVCRKDAIHSVGGFDSSIKGMGEDGDLFIRIKTKGWGISVNEDAIIYHRMRDSWRSLWRESIWWGGGRLHLQLKYRAYFPSLRQNIKHVILNCIKFTLYSIKMTGDPLCLLMPLFYVYRRFGFLMGHIKARSYLKTSKHYRG